MQQEPFSSIEDFIFDASFRSWLLDNNSVHKAHWENWIKENPAKAPVLNYAKAIVYALTVNHKQLSDEEMESEIKMIMRRTSFAKPGQDDTNENASSRRSLKPFFLKMAIAATVIALCLLTIIYFEFGSPQEDRDTDFYRAGLKKTSSVIDQSNNSDSIQLVTLFDGSQVQLYPKSKLSFSHGTFSKKREVYLIGEAFFNVKKNPSVPFVVYTKDLVTKVLGTTFNVQAYPNESNASVKVRTGKVSVYRKENFSDKNTVANKLDGVIVVPNQQVVYDVVSHQMRKTIIDEPVVLANNIRERFVFNSTPLKEVFKKLQDTYGITIIYDESVISSCSLSASMGDENFYEKLELICKAINASYESIDGTIFISAQGCK